MFRDRFLQIGRDKCFDDHCAGRILLVKHALVEQRLDAVPGKQRTDLVPGQQLHSAIFRPNRCTHAVAIRISRHNKVGICFLSKLDCHC